MGQPCLLGDGNIISNFVLFGPWQTRVKAKMLTEAFSRSKLSGEEIYLFISLHFLIINEKCVSTDLHCLEKTVPCEPPFPSEISGSHLFPTPLLQGISRYLQFCGDGYGYFLEPHIIHQHWNKIKHVFLLSNSFSLHRICFYYKMEEGVPVRLTHSHFKCPRTPRIDK